MNEFDIPVDETELPPPARALSALVFVLDADGPDTLPSRGWRGHVVAVRPYDAPVGAVVAATNSEHGWDLELHTVVRAPEGKWIVLRGATRYRVAAP